MNDRSHGASGVLLGNDRAEPGSARRCTLLAGRVIVVALGIFVSGCAIDGIGFASSEVTQASGAVVIRTETIGAALRTAATDAGLAIGYTSTLVMLPDGPDAPRAGTYYFGVSTAGLPAVASVRRVIGIDLDANRRAVGFTVGFSEDATLGQIGRELSVMRRFSLSPDDPSSAELRICQEVTSCE
jgi:hypothetical protein